MQKFRIIQYALGLFGIALLISVIPGSSERKIESAKTKIILRSVGDQLLLTAGDSSSLASPIRLMGEREYQIAFQADLAIIPDSLVSIFNETLERSAIPLEYMVEVKTCSSEEISYSFKMSQHEGNVIPCLGRILPTNCYLIQVDFQDENALLASFSYALPFLGISVVISILFAFLSGKLKTGKNSKIKKIGSSVLNFEERVLINRGNKINLTGKECEILTLLSLRPNQVISRDQLISNVWESKGVIVGRSLDTYISKLRKKLEPDPKIKIINIHGKGYKLEL